MASGVVAVAVLAVLGLLVYSMSPPVPRGADAAGSAEEAREADQRRKVAVLATARRAAETAAAAEPLEAALPGDDESEEITMQPLQTLEMHLVGVAKSGTTWLTYTMRTMLLRACGLEPQFSSRCHFMAKNPEHAVLALTVNNTNIELSSYCPAKHDIKTGNKDSRVNIFFGCNRRKNPEETAAEECAARLGLKVYSTECMPPSWRERREQLRMACRPEKADNPCARAKSAFVEVIRDPRDVLVSWVHYYNEATHEGRVSDESASRYRHFVTRLALFYQWYEWMAEFRPVHKFYYEEMLADTRHSLRRLAAAWGLPLREETFDSIQREIGMDAMKKVNKTGSMPNHGKLTILRAAKAGGFRSELSKAAVDMLTALMRQHLQPELQAHFLDDDDRRLEKRKEEKKKRKKEN